MAFGKKYNFSFNDFYGTENVIEIEQESYTGAVSNIETTSGNPVSIEYAGDGKELYEDFVFGSKLTFEIIVQNEGDYDEFLAVDEREYRVKYKRASTSETKYKGYFLFSEIATDPVTGAYVDPFDDAFADYSLHYSNDECRYTKLRYKIGGTVIAEYDPTPFVNDISAEVAIHQLLINVVAADSSYSISDENGDGFYDRLTKTDNYSFSDTATIEKYYEQCDTNGWLQEGIGAFGNGYAGDNFQLKVDENGSVTTFFDYTLESGDSKQDIISAAVSAINSNSDYKAEQDSENSDKILVEENSDDDASGYTLQVTTSSTNNDWDITASGLTEETTEAYEVIWTGFVVSGISERPYTSAPYKFLLEATDGIGDLENVNFDFEDNNRLSEIRALALALQNTGLNINIKSAANIFEDSMSTTVEDDPFEQTYIQSEAILSQNCRRIIKRILNKQNCDLKQSEGTWWITPVDSVDSIDYRTFDYQGNYTDNGSYNKTLSISNVSDHINNDKAINIGMDAKLMIEAAYKSFIYKQNYGRKDQLIKDPTFSIFNANEELYFWDGGIDYFQNIEKYLEFNSADVKIRQTFNVLDQPFEISLSYKGSFFVEIIDNDNKWYIGGGNWVDYQWQFELTNDEFKTKKWNVSGHSANYISVWITSGSTGGDVLKTIKANPADTAYEKGIRQELTYPAFGDYQKEPKELEFSLGDVPIDDWSPYRYLNLTTLSDGSQTDAWTTNKLARTTAEIIAKEICQNSRKITGSFRFKIFPFAIHVMYSDFDNKYYKLMGGTLDIKSMIFSGKWIEINKSDPGVLSVQDKLYDGEPSGVSTYSTNRESYDSGGGGGTVFDIPDEYVTEDELQAGLQGEPITFYGYDLDSEKSIELTHGLKRTNVITIIAVNGVPIDPANFRREYITDLKIKLNILKPYEDTTEFTARFL